jgi:hypothetical protein
MLGIITGTICGELEACPLVGGTLRWSSGLKDITTPLAAVIQDRLIELLL